MTEEVTTPKKRRWFWRGIKALLLLLLLLGLVVLALQFPRVQNYVADQITGSLSKKLDAEVTVGDVAVSINTGVRLEDFLIRGREGDTILAAQALQVGLDQSLLSLFRKEADLSSVKLTGPRVHVVTKRGEEQSNIANMLAKLVKAQDPSKPKTESTKLDLQELEITDLELSIADENKGSLQQFSVADLYVTFDTLLVDGLLAIDELRVTKPVVRISKRGEKYELETESKAVAAVTNTLQKGDPLRVKIGTLAIAGGIVSYNDYNKSPLKVTDVIDYNHFEVTEVELDLSELVLEDGPDVKLSLQHLSFIDDKGFRLKEFRARGMTANNQNIALSDFKIVTANTVLQENVSLTFTEFDDLSSFATKVNLNAKLTQSRVFFADVMHFVGSLRDDKFFSKNKSRYLSLAGSFKGPLDRLAGNNVVITVDNKLQLKSNFSARNLTKRDRELINFGVKELHTDMEFLRDFIPGFSPPSNFYKLGDIDFKGRFDGYLKDFVAYGSVQTEMGDGFLDMRLDIKNGVEQASYSGELNLEDFDLRSWSDNDDLGMVNFTASIEDGKGLTLNSVDTELNAIVESIIYKGYKYQDFVMDGHLSKNEFDGEFSITDDNIDLIFDGNVKLVDDIPVLDFKANIEKIDLASLNLSKKPFLVRGNIDINGSGKTINDVEGKMIASDLYIATNDTVYVMDTLSLQSAKAGTVSSLYLYSDIAKVELQGVYDLSTVVPSFKKMLKSSYPHYTQNWNLRADEVTGDQDIVFKFELQDTRNFLELAGVKGLRIRDFTGDGRMDTRDNQLVIEGDIPYVGIGTNTINNAKLSLRSLMGRGEAELTIDSTNWGGKAYNPIVASSKMKGDTVNVFVGTTGLADSLERLEIGAQLIPHEKGYAIQLADKEIEMLGRSWTFKKDNELIIGEKYIQIENLRLSDGTRSIIVDDINKRGISAFMLDFNFNSLNSLINYPKMYFAGRGDVSVYVDDLFATEQTYEANVYVDQFTINNDPFGTLEVEVAKPYGKPIDVKFGLGTDSTGLSVLGSLDPDNNNYLDAEVVSEDFNLHIFEYILKDGISNVYGEVDLQGKVRGPIDALKIDAKAKINNAGLKILYTGASYTIDQQAVTCTEKFIDFTGAKLIDRDGEQGVITGGIYHDLFTKFGVDANLSGEDVIAINTTKEDNELYYGFAKGDVSVDFDGPFEQLDMKVVCTTGPGTVINIPISDGTQSSEKSFIEFVDKETLFQDQLELDKDFKIEGMGIEIDLTMTEDAKVNLIFDESKGDIIAGTGRGALKMYITRYGDFDIYGDYNIEEGEYLFTAWGLVAKPFEVRRGSTIRWTGDPVNAELAIKADYSVRTPLSIFLGEYLIEGSRAAAESNNRTQVDLILNLGGTLYKPAVSFDLDFPDVNGELASVTDNKMRSLRTNQSDLNNQVLGLIVFNTFLPSNNSGSTAGADIGAAGVSTLSEFVGSQLSRLFTGLINDALADDGLISGIDFEIGLNKNSLNGVDQSSTDVLPDEIEVNLKNRFRFLDERLSLGVGGNYVRQSVLRTNNNYFVGDFVIEYFLSTDRKLKLKVYGTYDYDENLLGRRQKYGVGIGYRTEFGSLTDFRSGLSEQLKEDVLQEAEEY